MTQEINSSKIQKLKDSFIRDVTKIPPMPKSEVRARLKEITDAILDAIPCEEIETDYKGKHGSELLGWNLKSTETKSIIEQLKK